ncbi:non-functional pseudokinase ZED1-like [Forsythia ovata]|uniref:Non-functional pseudokinase ZED1-like n=1 Tax=Forsythia ovata TaxID=205694 RepID=A0ABD1VM78_9LAMI
MNPLKKFMSCFGPNQKEEISVRFLKNKGELLEELIASFDGRHRIPIVLIRATDDFAEMIGRTPGFSEDVPPGTNQPPKLNGAINDIVIRSQMGHLKYVLKLIGCRLEFKYPGTVYKDVEMNSLLIYSTTRIAINFSPGKAD